jgi:hypothetical protein
MSFFNKIQVTFLNFAQKVVTITTGSDIGINNILQIIESNFDDIKRIFDPSIAGGGINGENINTQTISSKHTNFDFVEQGNQNFIAINKTAQPHVEAVVLNGAFLTTVPNKKYLVIVETAYEKADNNNLDGCLYNSAIDFSTSSSFPNSTLQTYGSIAGLGMIPESAYGNHRRPLVHTHIITIATAGVTYYRVRALIDGGAQTGNVNNVGARVTLVPN